MVRGSPRSLGKLGTDKTRLPKDDNGLSLKVTLTLRGFSRGVLLLIAALSAMPAHARPHHGEAWARDHFAAAERMREALNGRPPTERTRREFRRVLFRSRSVYYGAPTSSKADPSAVAVAETLVEMGRRFEDDKILNSAITQYKFLRKEYPGSKYRGDALFTIGEIYKDDLDDPDQARATFEEFLKRYPRNRLVEDAQQAIAELKKESVDKRAQAEIDAQSEKKAEARPGGGIGDKPGEKQKVTAQTASDPQPETKETESRDETASSESSESDQHRLPRVTAIRHWSTPDYTRVAIDLESEVKFGSQRISHPDRIFFDLRDTKLASTLVGKTFEVDDGFLKKIRVAQFQPGRTRVVLEVDDLSTYEAFLLPNPYRLIIDIHGKNSRKNMHAKLLKDSAAMADVEAPPTAGSGLEGAIADDLTPEEALKEAEAKVKGDLRADAGKAPVTSEDVGDETKIAPKANSGASKTNSRSEEHTSELQ